MVRNLLFGLVGVGNREVLFCAGARSGVLSRIPDFGISGLRTMLLADKIFIWEQETFVHLLADCVCYLFFGKCVCSPRAAYFDEYAF